MKATILVLMLAIMVATAAASPCFTAVNVPQNTNHYWKAITYDTIQDGNLANAAWLQSTGGVTSAGTLGAGYQYNIRVDQNCFNNYLPQTLDATGIASSTLFVQKYGDDLHSSDNPQSRTYTISRQDTSTASNKYVKDIATGTIGGINYWQKPASFADLTKHPKYNSLKEGLCNWNQKASEQMDRITDKVWAGLAPGSMNCGSQYTNIVDCALETGKANPEAYATLVALLARDCKVPARVVKGISEGTFDGLDIRFDQAKTHYWIEYWAGQWYTLEATESGSTLPTSIETNCLDASDNDHDTLVDCRDPDCSKVLYCQGNYPTTTKFYNTYSTNLEQLANVYRINLLILGNEFGEIKWENQALDLRNKELDTMADLSANKATITDSALNKPNTILLNKLAWTTPEVLRNNQPCPQCAVTYYKNGVASFTTPGIGTYTTREKILTPIRNVTANTTSPGYLPTIPAKTGTWGKIGWLKSLGTWFGNLSTLLKVGIVAAIVFGIWYWNNRRRQAYAPSYR